MHAIRPACRLFFANFREFRQGLDRYRRHLFDCDLSVKIPVIRPEFT